MKILIINHNGGSIYHGPNLRTYYAAKELVAFGHTVTAVSSSFSHKYSLLPKVTGAVTSEEIDGVHYKWIKCAKYKNIIQRIYSHFEFGIKLLRYQKKICNDLDVVIFSGPPPELFLFSWVYAKLHGVPVISDIRDLWPRTQLEMNRWQWLNPFTYFLFLCQFIMVRFSDRLVTPLPGAENYLVRVGAKQHPVVIENGYDLTRPKVGGDENKITIAVCDSSTGLRPGVSVPVSSLKGLNKFVVGYAGAFDRDNDIDSFLCAAKDLVHRSDILFLMVGDGIRKAEVLDVARCLPNVIVCERVPSQMVPHVLEVMDVCYCGLKPKNIYKYGVSLAKTFEYMAAGKPILWMIDAFNNPIKESGGGIIIEPGNVMKLVEAIMLCAAKDAAELHSLGGRGFEYLMRNHSYGVLGKRWDCLVSGVEC